MQFVFPGTYVLTLFCTALGMINWQFSTSLHLLSV